MKKILFAAFAASLLAAGCQKTEVYQPANSGEKMTFSTEMKKITKAEGDGTTSKNEGTQSLEKQGFNLWAYAAYSTENITNVDAEKRVYDGMDAMALKYTEESGWQPNPNKEYYWPGQGKDLRVFAVSTTTTSPTVTINHGITEGKDHTITLENPTMTISDFTVSGTDDLMVADFLDQNQSENSRVVNLNFHHALSKVEFLFKATKPDNVETLDVYVQQLVVKDLNTKGALSVTTTNGFPTTGDTFEAPVTLSWGEESTKSTPLDFTQKSQTAFTGTLTDKVLDSNNNPEFSDNVATKLENNAEATTFAKWLMLPQSIDGKLVEIIYIINNRQFKAVFPLDASTASTGASSLDTWEINKYIKYTINLSPNMISFDANVETDWEEDTSGIDHIN